MADDTKPTFEAALRDLQRIVSDLERGEPELSSALAKYEQGVKLLAQCQRVLEQAEKAVSLLSGVQPDGSPITSPFDETASTEPNPKPVKEKTPKRRAVKPSDEPDEPFIPF
jgi:exodeoxyribonuclease VII small subunit